MGTTETTQPNLANPVMLTAPNVSDLANKTVWYVLLIYYQRETFVYLLVKKDSIKQQVQTTVKDVPLFVNPVKTIQMNVLVVSLDKI